MRSFFVRIRKVSVFSLLFFLCISLLSAQKSPSPLVKIPFPAGTLSWNPDDTKFAVGEEHYITVRDAKTSSPLYELPFDNVLLLRFADEGGKDMLLALSHDGRASIWDFKDDPIFTVVETDGDKKEVKAPTYELSVKSESGKIVAANFSRSSNVIVTALDDGSVTAYFKLRYTEVLLPKELTKHAQACYSVAVSPDEALVASASSDGKLVINNANSAEQICELDVFAKTKVPVLFTKDSSAIISASNAETLTIRSFDGKTQRKIKVKAEIRDIALSSDGNTLSVLTSDDRIRFFNLETGEYTGYIPPYNITKLTSFALSASGKYVLAGHADGSIYKLAFRNSVLDPDSQPPGLLSLDEDSLVQKGSAHIPDGIDEKNRNKYQEELKNGLSIEELMEELRKYREGGLLPSGKIIEYPEIRTDVFGAILDEEKDNYSYAFGLDASIHTNRFTPPLYQGAGLRLGFGLPKDDYPYTYTDSDGNDLGAPYLTFAELYIPVGIDMIVENLPVNIFFEAAPALRFNMLSNFGVAYSSVGLSANIRLATGIRYSHYSASLSFTYDSMLGFSPELHLGFIIPIKLKPKAESSEVKE